MAPRKVANPRRSAQYYRDNPEAYKKKLAYDKKYGAQKRERDDRAEHNRARRKAGVYGKGGGDMSRTKNGGFVRENPSTNRARNRGKK
jgi:hypothetical protein